MLNLRYNLSSALKNNLLRMEELRQKIHLVPLSAKNELRFRWETAMHKVYYSLINGSPDLSKSRVVKILTSISNKKITGRDKEVADYKKALDYIGQYWLAEEREVTLRTLSVISQIAGLHRIKLAENALKQLLVYLNTSRENPVTNAAITYIQIIKLLQKSTESEKLAGLMAEIFLYKEGYNFRGFLATEEYFATNRETVTKLIAQTEETSDLTAFLEFYLQGIVETLDKIYRDLQNLHFRVTLPSSFWELTDRQRDIISNFDSPEAIITNKKIQKLFRISQITSSRDLSKLVTLGLLFPHGKGRSVYYSRA